MQWRTVDKKMPWRFIIIFAKATPAWREINSRASSLNMVIHVEARLRKLPNKEFDLLKVRIFPNVDIELISIWRAIPNNVLHTEILWWKKPLLSKVQDHLSGWLFGEKGEITFNKPAQSPISASLRFLRKSITQEIVSSADPIYQRQRLPYWKGKQQRELDSKGPRDSPSILPKHNCSAIANFATNIVLSLSIFLFSYSITLLCFICHHNSQQSFL